MTKMNISVKIQIMDRCFLSCILGLTRLLASSGNSSHHYHILAEAWKKWRDQTGKKMKVYYEKMVKISNEAINVLGKFLLKLCWSCDFSISS